MHFNSSSSTQFQHFYFPPRESYEQFEWKKYKSYSYAVIYHINNYFWFSCLSFSDDITYDGHAAQAGQKFKQPLEATKHESKRCQAKDAFLDVSDISDVWDNSKVLNLGETYACTKACQNNDMTSTTGCMGLSQTNTPENALCGLDNSDSVLDLISLIHKQKETSLVSAFAINKHYGYVYLYTAGECEDDQTFVPNSEWTTYILKDNTARRPSGLFFRLGKIFVILQM